jgi:hypothetical protein
MMETTVTMSLIAYRELEAMADINAALKRGDYLVYTSAYGNYFALKEDANAKLILDLEKAIEERDAAYRKLRELEVKIENKKGFFK